MTTGIEGYGGNTLTVTGGNNSFVVVYKFEGSEGSGAGGMSDAGGPPAGTAFGAAGSLNNTDPNFDFSTLDDGKVYQVEAGGDDMTIEGGNKQFVLEYTLPDTPEGHAAMGDNTVSVEGANNKFVVAYEYPEGSEVSGNKVSIDGGNNQFVVDYSYAGSGAPASDGGGAPQFADSDDNAGVTIGAAGGNEVTVNGEHNQYAIQYGNAPSAEGDSAMGGNPFAGGGGQNPFAGGGMSAPAGEASSPMGGEMSGDMSQMNSENLPANGQNPFAGGGGGGGSNPFAGGAAPAAGGDDGQSNPNYVYDFPAEDSQQGAASGAAGGNPFAGGMAGGAPTGGDAAGGGMAGGGNPFAGGMAGGGAPTGDDAAGGGAMAGGSAPMGGDMAGGGAMASGGAPASGDLDALLAQSPFGRLLDIPGVNGAEDIFGNLGDMSGGANPFAAAGIQPGADGNPFANIGSIGENGYANAVGGMAGGASAGGNPFAGGAPAAAPTSDAAAAAPADAATAPSPDAAAAAPTDVAAAPAETDAGYVYDFADADMNGEAFATGGDMPAAVDGSDGASAPVDMSSMLANSPFGPLLQIPGVTEADITDIFAGSNDGGGNPFAIEGNDGNPFGLGDAITAMVQDAVAALPADQQGETAGGIQAGASAIASDPSTPSYVASIASSVDGAMANFVVGQSS